MKRTIFAVILILTFCLVDFAQDSLKNSQESKIPLGEASFTEEQLEDYYKAYENDDVKYLRRVFDKPLAKNDEELNLLKAFDKQYFRSKFIVLSRDPDMFGNVHIMLVF
jgi:hypothetical protein